MRMLLRLAAFILQPTMSFGMNVNQVLVTGMWWTKDSIAEGSVLLENSNMEACLMKFNVHLLASPDELGFWVNDEGKCVLVTKIGIRTSPEHTDAEPRLVWFRDGVESGMGNIAGFGTGANTIDHGILSNQNFVKPEKFTVSTNANNQVGFVWNYIFVLCKMNIAVPSCQGQYAGKSQSPKFTMEAIPKDHFVGYTLQISKDKVWVTGGKEVGVRHSESSIFENGHWRPGPALPEKLEDHCVALADEKTAIFAGGIMTGIVNSMLAWKFDLDTEVWTPIADAPINAVQSACASLVEGKVVFAGGKTSTGNNMIDTTRVYDVAADSWTTVHASADWTIPDGGFRLNRMITDKAGVVYALGGRMVTGNAYIVNALVFDPEVGWTKDAFPANLGHQGAVFYYNTWNFRGPSAP